MRNFFLTLMIVMLSFSQTYSYTEYDTNAADFLAEKGIIQTSSDYKLDSTITRREMLKVMMNLSGKPIATTCTGKFQDLQSSDWGCKYAEAALENGYISANTYFRPNDHVTNIEALKMIMQARGIQKSEKYYLYCEYEDGCPIVGWEEQYRYGQREFNLIDEGGIMNQGVEGKRFIDSDFTLRSKVFSMSARTYEMYKSKKEYWRVFETKEFKIAYPEYWIYREYADGKIFFGNSLNISGGLNLGITKDDSGEYTVGDCSEFEDTTVNTPSYLAYTKEVCETFELK